MENKKNTKPNKKKDNTPKFNSYWIYGLVILALIGINLVSLTGYNKEPISMKRFQELVNSGDIDRVELVNEKYAQVYLDETVLSLEKYADAGKPGFTGQNPHYYFNVGPIENFQKNVDEWNEELADEQQVEIKYTEKENWLGPLLSWIFPMLIIIAIWMFIMRRMSGGGGPGGGQLFNIGKSKAKLFDKESKVNTTFKDVAGLQEAKEEVMEVVDFLKHPDKYTALGGKIPKGVLLVGEPGTGKTLLAKAVAGEADVPFFSISGSDFVEMFVGVGASRVRDLFKQAREKAPCIIFIDEIDAIGRARGKNAMQGGNDERENTLNQLLVEMDGFDTDAGVILMAATNRPDVLDPALLRPGRFDRQIGIDKPDLKGREAIFKVHLKNIKISDSIKPEELAEMTPGFAGADIANVCNEAALIAARRNKKAVDLDDFNYALDRVIGGLEKKNKVISPKEKKIIAYHEAGHAICGWYLEHASPLVKVTIVPRGIGTLGYAQYLPKEEYITTTEQMEDRLCMTMGGRAAEKIIFDKISTGAQNDLDQVTKMAYSMVTIYGMNERVGNVSFYGMQNNQFEKPYSDDTATMIDEEVRQQIDTQYKRAQKLLTERSKELELLALQLLEKEVLLKSDLIKLIGERPFPEDEPLLSESKPQEGTNTEENTQQQEDNSTNVA